MHAGKKRPRDPVAAAPANANNDQLPNHEGGGSEVDENLGEGGSGIGGAGGGGGGEDLPSDDDDDDYVLSSDSSGEPCWSRLRVIMPLSISFF